MERIDLGLFRGKLKGSLTMKPDCYFYFVGTFRARFLAFFFAASFPRFHFFS